MRTGRPVLVFLSLLTTMVTSVSAFLAAPAAAAPNAGTKTQCGGPLAFGSISVCPSIRGNEHNVYTLTTTADADKLFTELTRGSGDGVSGTVTSSSGETVCYLNTDAGTCQLGAAGAYKITVSLYHPDGAGNYSLAVESMRTPSACTVLPGSFFSFASPGRTATLPAGAAARCYRFTQPVGSVLHMGDPRAGGASVQGDVLDGQYEPLPCSIGYAHECTLTRPGPYRLFLFESYGTEATYTLRMPRISHSTGCPRLRLAPFGDPGGAVGSGTIAGRDGLGCHKLRTATAGPVAMRINPGRAGLVWTVYTDEGAVACASYLDWRSCRLPEPGAYTLIVQDSVGIEEPRAYRVAATALFRSTGCAAATGTSWDLPTLVVHQTSAVQTNCQPFAGAAGERIVIYGSPSPGNDRITWLADSTGTALCTDLSEETGCVLPATGTYRVVSYRLDWSDETTDVDYRLQVRRLSDPVGCPTVRPGTYGAPPAGALGGIRCRILAIPAAGDYRLQAADAQNHETFGQVYDTAGRKVCGSPQCGFAAPGNYTMVLNGSDSDAPVIDNDYAYAVALLPVVPSGCEQVTDTGYLDAPHRGRLSTPGQFNCLRLPTPAGARIVELLPGDADAAGRPWTTVVDATGAFVCDSSFGLRTYSCELTGTAPFFAVLSEYDGNPAGPYAVAFARVDTTPACPVVPRGEEGATAATGADHFVACFVIPADQHGAAETFTFRRVSGAGEARLSIFASDGIRWCGPLRAAAERTFTCPDLPDRPVTVLLEADSVNAVYQLTHR